MGDPIQDSSRRRLSKLNKSPRISSTVSEQNRITTRAAEKDNSGRYNQNISPVENKGLKEGIKSPDRVWTRPANFRTSSINPPSDYADYFANGYDEIDEWDKTQPSTDSIFGSPELEEGKAVAGQEDAKIVVDLPKAKCRLTVSASINQLKDSSKIRADPRFVDVTLFLEGKRGSCQQKVNLAIPDEDSQEGSGSGNLVIFNEGGQRSGGFRVAEGTEKAADGKRRSYQQAGNLAIFNEGVQSSGGSRTVTETKKVAEGNRGSCQHTVNLVIADEGVQRSGGSRLSKSAKKATEDKKKSYQQIISLTISDEDGQRSGGSRVPEVAKKAAEGKDGSYRLSLDQALSDDHNQRGEETGVLKMAKKMAEVPSPEMHLVDVEQFWIQESDERYIVTDDYEESRSEESTILMDEGPVTVDYLMNQPVYLGTSIDWVPEDECILRIPPLRYPETSMVEEWCAMGSLSDVVRNSAQASEEVYIAPNHEVCQIERMSSFSAFTFLVNCLTTERQLLTLVKKLSSFSGEWVVVKTLEVVECVNRLQLIFVEALALQSSVKASLNMHREREVSSKKLRILEAGNNSSTSPNAIVQESKPRRQDGTKQLPEVESDHRTSQVSEKIPPQELTDEVIKDNQFIESGNDLEPCSPIIAQSVSELERRLHSAFLTRKRCRIRAIS